MQEEANLQIQALKAQIEQQKTLLKTKQETHTTLAKTLQSKQTEVQNLQKQCNDTQGLLENVTEEWLTLLARTGAAALRHRGRNPDLNKPHETMLEELIGELFDAEKDLGRLKSESCCLEEEMCGARETCERLENSLEDLEKVIRAKQGLV